MYVDLPIHQVCPIYFVGSGSQLSWFFFSWDPSLIWNTAIYVSFQASILFGQFTKLVAYGFVLNVRPQAVSIYI